MPNRLADSSSPYLLQHAHNPVEWFPWGEEALARARAEERPILLSIGYSACHWCHVMERESFEDPETAGIMNDRFVNIKVDREERPDVDQIYMKAVQAMTGSGGWPLTVFLTPDARPYYGGTYFPPAPRHGMPSFRQVLHAAADAWTKRRDDVERAATEMVESLGRMSGPAGSGTGAALPADLTTAAAAGVARRFDPVHGGFGRAPKFPQPTTLEALLVRHAVSGDPELLHIVVHTLRRMAAGGLRDHLAGGFHRYSVDARWLVPHFEKMLYDNALLARLYVDAWRVTRHPDLQAVAEETLDYVLADLRAPEGGFYSARDADSEGEEGRFYVWTQEELTDALGDEASIFLDAYGVTPGGNFEGHSILHLPEGLDVVAERLGVEPAALERTLKAAREVLLERRTAREHPLRDEKILVAWNGMTVRALAEAGAAFGRTGYVEAAATAARFLLKSQRSGDRLLRVWAGGRAHIDAFLEDWAALGNALVSLHAATLNPDWLKDVLWCCEGILERFWDPQAGLFYDAGRDAEALIVRPRDATDGATPSGNSLAAELLARAGHLLDDDRYRDVAQRVVAAEADGARRYPSAFGRLLVVADRLGGEPVEVAVVGPPGTARGALLAAAAAAYLPSGVVAGRAPGEPLPVSVPLLEGRGEVEGAPAAYVCRRYVCSAPATTPAEVAAALRAPA